MTSQEIKFSVVKKIIKIIRILEFFNENILL